MPNQLGIIHPDMFEALTPNFYPSLLTVQAATVTQSPTGAPIHGWANVVGMTGLSCRIAPAGGAESKTQTQVIAQNTQTCVVPADLPAISVLMRAVVDGETFDIVSIDYDGQQLPGSVRRSTRLTLKVVS